MKTRKKTYPLSTKGIQNLIDYLDTYKAQLMQRTIKLMDILAEKGIEEADMRFEVAGNEGTDTEHNCLHSVTFDGENVVLEIEIEGKDLIFIEFGAGIYYNPGKLGQSAHESPEFREAFPEFKIGKYGTNKDKEWSLGANDTWVHNGQEVHGTKATMPLYGAELAIINSVKEAVQEAFEDME